MLPQTPEQIVNVTEWAVDEEFPIFPVGSKPKRLLRCPDEAGLPSLIAGHSYLFKVAHGWRAQQLWSEVIAYRVAAVVGLNVPPCFVATDSGTGEVGALVEFFYGYPGEAEPARFVPAADLLERFRTDGCTDRPHSIRLNLKLCRGLGLRDAADWWARVLTFDALIGNSDRHPENWGILHRIRPGGQEATLAFAPPFDHGTSLGYEITETKLGTYRDPARLQAYIESGCHHCGWDFVSDHRTPHMDLCRRFADAFPDHRDQMRAVAEIDPDEVTEIGDACSRFQVNPLFTRDRAHFVAELIAARKERLLTILGG
jgi:hypothetical protein